MVECKFCSNKATARCADCLNVAYCSKKCQAEDWNNHSIDCHKDGMPIAKIVKKDGRFDILENLLEEADLLSVFYSPGPYTVFAPTDDAFKQLPNGLFGQLMRDKSLLTQVLTGHVVQGKVTSADIIRSRKGSVMSLNQTPIEYMATNQGVVINNDSRVIAADIRASNGIIHAIDYPILPQ
jgi:uncharacterized surface protein with fasciclin (FAS1) repeats